MLHTSLMQHWYILYMHSYYFHEDSKNNNLIRYYIIKSWYQYYELWLWIKKQTKKNESSSKMCYSRAGRGLRTWNFKVGIQGVLKNKIWKFHGSIRKEKKWNFQGYQEKIMWNFHAWVSAIYIVFSLGNSGVLWNFQRKLHFFSLEFPRVKRQI